MSAYFGDSEGAIRELRTALHLLPFEPLRHISFIGMGCAHFVAERYERAALWVRSGVEVCPGSFWAERIAIAAAALMGARAEARRGEEIVITQYDRPVLKLVPVVAPPARRKAGSAKGLITMASDFDVSVVSIPGSVAAA